ncbi:MAG: hypothetical protein ACP5EP_11660 [Acidobacteriaceae bacterium]
MARYSQKKQLGWQNPNTQIQREAYPDWGRPNRNPQRQVYRCPICNNPQIRSMVSIYGRGVYTSVSRRGRFLKRGYTTRTSKSLLADKCAPPEKRRYAFGVFLVFFAAGIELVAMGPLQQSISQEYATMAAIAFGWLGLYIVTRAWWWNFRTFPRLWDRWQRSYLCERCGTITAI